MTAVKKLFEYIDSQKKQAKEFLCELIKFPSTCGNEAQIQRYIFSRFQKLGIQTEPAAIDDSIKGDLQYSHCTEDIDYRDKANVVATLKGAGGGKSVIFNCHSDVVPADEWPGAFRPKIEGDIIIGRGACDDKGQIAALYLVLAAIKAAGVQLGGDVTAQFVIEEENGGNGTLALIRKGCRADAAVVLEPTELKIHPANRGAVWFKITVRGKSVHMGRITEGISAIERMMEVIGLLKEYEKKLTAESKGHPLFVMYQQPVMVNIGTINGGDWPATVPGKAVIEGSIGFLPDRTLEQIKAELREVIIESSNEWLRDNCSIEFCKLHNEAFETDTKHPLVTTFQQAVREMQLPDELSGFIVSCDGRLFNRIGNIPTIVFGPGSLSYAHSNNEQIDINEIIKAAKTLILFIDKWCKIAARGS